MDADDLIAYWKQAEGNYIHPEDKAHIEPAEFALNLHPVPWVGPLKTAQVFILFLNPGLSEEDAPYEQNNPQFVNTLADNLLGEEPYIYLQQRYLDHPGFNWAASVFGQDLTQFHLENFCVLQLVPYHSKFGNVAIRKAKVLPSSLAIRRFVSDSLLPRAKIDQIGLIVARSSKLWGVHDLSDSNSIVVYRGWECRRGFQRSNSRGGQLLRRFIK